MSDLFTELETIKKEDYLKAVEPQLAAVNDGLNAVSNKFVDILRATRETDADYEALNLLSNLLWDVGEVVFECLEHVTRLNAHEGEPAAGRQVASRHVHYATVFLFRAVQRISTAEGHLTQATWSDKAWSKSKKTRRLADKLDEVSFELDEFQRGLRKHAQRFYGKEQTR